MSKSKITTKGGRVSAKIIIIIFAAILLAGVVAGVMFLAQRTNGFAEDFKSFYVETDGKRYYTNGDTVTLRMNSITSFKCGYSPLNKDLNDLQTYNVKITSVEPSKATFNYTLDGDAYAFLGGEDYTTCFNITESKDSFTISNIKDTPLDILQRKYIGHEVGGNIPDMQQAYFKLTVSASDGKQSVSFMLKLEYVTLTLPGEIIF